MLSLARKKLPLVSAVSVRRLWQYPPFVQSKKFGTIRNSPSRRPLSVVAQRFFAPHGKSAAAVHRSGAFDATERATLKRVLYIDY